MAKWLKANNDRPPLRDPVWGYGCDGSLLVVCRMHDYNRNSEWDLGKGKSECWCVLRRSGSTTEGELLPFNFITHWTMYDAKTDVEPAEPTVSQTK